MTQMAQDTTRVMLVTDDALAATEVAQQIGPPGYEVATVGHAGGEAVRVAAEQRPDLVLLEFPLGDTDAIELARRLRDRQQVPVIFLVGPEELPRLAAADLPRPFIFVVRPDGMAGLRSTLALSLELHRLEQALTATNQRHRQATASFGAVEALAQLGSWTHEPADGELTFSAECLRIHGLDPHASCPTLAALWRHVPRTDRDKLEVLVRRAHEEGQSYTTEYRVALPAGDERVVHHRVAVEADREGHTRQLVAVVQDVTAQRRAEEELRQSEAHISSLLEERDFILQNSRDVLYYIDTNGILFYISPAVEHLTGIPPEEWKGDFRQHLVDNARTRQAVRETFEILRTGREYPPAILEFKKKDGGVLSAEVSERPIVKEGRVVGLVGVARDVSERLQVESRLRQAAAVFENTSEAIIITDPERRIAAVNRAFVDITGYTEAEVQGDSPEFLAAPDEPPQTRKAVWDAVAETGRWNGERWKRRKSGDAFPAWVTISTIRDAAQQVANFVIVMSDLSHVKESENKLDRISHYDPLTQLPNRLLFNTRLTHAIRRAERNGSSVAVMFIDLDNFKKVNDTRGHPAGDLLLQEVAKRLIACLRKEDTIARVGGDEFVIILEDVGDSRFLTEVASKVLSALCRPYRIDGEEAVISASAGISLFPQDGGDVTRLVQSADTAMYRAKELGRANFQFYTAELTARAIERMNMENALRSALRREEFVLYYQPQVSFETDEVVGVEALIRWWHPERGLVMPNAFIELGEETGLILPIGDWVLRTACTQVKEWIDAGVKPLTLAVNVSARQFSGDASLVEKVAAVLNETGLAPHSLQLEITETAVMHDAEKAVDTINRLRDLGVSVAIDDFGKGYSSISYLKQFLVDKLKTHQSFVQHLPDDAGSAAITQAIIALGHSLQIKVVAEGVESAEQRAFLHEQGCDEMQGFIFSPPLPEQECRHLLKRGH